MSSQKPEYYRSRAVEERKSAARAPSAALVRVHEDLAAMYDQMAKLAEREREPALTD